MIANSLGAQLPDHHVTRKDLRPARRGSESSKYSERDERAKSPKKKIFGMSMPTFKTSSNNAPTPPMPAKVAKVLGTSPPGKARKPSPHSSNHTARFAMPRSDTSKSLPSKTYNQRDHHRRHRRHSPNHSTSSQHTASRRSPTKMVQFPNIKQGNHAHGSSSESLGPAPPPPPQKDTPPDRKGKYEVSQMSWLMRGPPPEERSKDPEDFIDKGMKLHIPIAPKVNPIPSNGGQSPSKYCPTGVEDHARLIEAERITSAYGELESIEDESEDRHSAPLENQNSGALETPRPPRWSDGHHLPPRTPLSAKLSGRKPQLQCLPASVYTPDSNSRVAGVGQPANVSLRSLFLSMCRFTGILALSRLSRHVLLSSISYMPSQPLLPELFHISNKEPAGRAPVLCCPTHLEARAYTREVSEWLDWCNLSGRSERYRTYFVYCQNAPTCCPNGISVSTSGSQRRAPYNTSETGT